MILNHEWNLLLGLFIHTHTLSHAYMHIHTIIYSYTYIDSCIHAHSYNQSRVSFIHTHTYMHSWWCWNTQRMAFRHTWPSYECWSSLKNMPFYMCSNSSVLFNYFNIFVFAHTCFLDLVHVGYARLCVILVHSNKNQNFYSISLMRGFYHLNQVGNNKIWRDKC